MISSIVWLLHKDFKAISGEYIEPHLLHVFEESMWVHWTPLLLFSKLFWGETHVPTCYFHAFPFSHHILAMFDSTYIVHDFIVFMLCMPIVCVLSTLLYITFMLRTPIVCIRSTLFHIAFLLHMLIQHMNTLYYILNRCNHLTMWTVLTLWLYEPFVTMWTSCISWHDLHFDNRHLTIHEHFYNC